jgi:uncharacterized integral membrane protein (TIGR00698 family)
MSDTAGGISGSGAQAALFSALLLFCFTPYATPPLALALGLGLALTAGHPWPGHNGRIVKYLLQASVVGLGFGMNFAEVLAAGRTGVVFTAVSIFGTLAAGWLIGRWLRIDRNTSLLISSGTAICGGSAIAAMAPILNAEEKEISVALGTVFILNSVALFLFPPIGHRFGLSQAQFGLWSAIAIHDTSSVVGAASRYGGEALKIATTIKLTRALWILPVSFGAALALKNRAARVAPPYFIFAFAAASLLVSVFPGFGPVYSGITRGARTGLTVTLFLIGAGLSRRTLKTVGVKPVLQGVLLWAIISTASFFLVTR